MTRVKRGTTSIRRRRKILGYTKGFRWGGRSKERLARERLLHAWTHAFMDRRKKKGDFRRLWTVRINAGVRAHGLSYSQFIQLLKKHNIQLDRKVLADIAEHHPAVFKKIVEVATERE